MSEQTRNPAHRVLAAVLTQPWAIVPDWLPAIAAIAARDVNAPELVALRAARPMNNGYKAEIRDGVAIVPVTGPIFPRANIMTDLSGATAVSDLATDFQAALDDPEVKAIVLNIDSPGGAVAGIGEFAGHVAAARGKKPVVAYAGGTAASAAYWIATAADRIVVAPSAVLGSIGVVTGGGYQESPDADGYRHVEIVSSNAADKRVNLATDEGRGKVQALLDQIETVFLADVAKNRNVTVEKVLADFGRGGMKAGAHAVAAGMADAVGTFEGLLAELAAASLTGVDQTQTAAAAAAMEQSMTDKTQTAAAPTVETIEKDHPAIAAHFVKAGADAERTRILGVQGQLVAGHETLIAGLVADGKTTPGEAAMAIVAAGKAQGGAALNALKTGFEGNGVTATVTASPNAGGADAPKTPEQEWDACAEGQGVKAEFGGDKAAFLAFKTAEAKGQARIKKSA